MTETEKQIEHSEVPAPSRRLPRLAFAAGSVLVLSAGLFFARLGDRALWSMELRWAEIPREMRLAGDYFTPTINGRPYYDKPLGSYWLVLAASYFSGGLDETSARLPSAFSGLIGVGLLMLLARRLYDGRTAVLAGFILATSFSFVFFARHASADLENVTGNLAALVLFVYCEKRPPGPWLIGLWLIMAATSLTKGLLGFALPLAVLGSYRVLATGRAEAARGLFHGLLMGRVRWLSRRLDWLLNRWSLLGAIVAAAVFLTPFLISMTRHGASTGLYMVYRENIQRFFNAHNHHGPIYIYAYVIFGLMAPWSVLLPAAIMHAHGGCPENDRMRQGDGFARAYFWATFLFFTLASSRRSYYLMPVLPAGALLVARVLTAREELASVVRRMLVVGFTIVAFVVVLVGGSLMPSLFVLPEPWRQLPQPPALTVLVACWLVSLTAMLYALCRFNRRRATFAMGCTATLFLGYIFQAALPVTEDYRGVRTLAAETRRLVGPATNELAFYRTREPVFYLGLSTPVAEFDQPEPLLEATHAGQVRWVLARRRDLQDLPFTIVAEEKIWAWQSDAQRGNKLVLARPRLGPSGQSAIATATSVE